MSRAGPMQGISEPAEIDTMLQQLRLETIVLTIPGLWAGFLILIAQPEAFKGFPFGDVAGLLVGAGVAIAVLRERHYLLAAWLLVTGSLLACMLLMAGSHNAGVLSLMAIPVGLATLFVSLPAGTGIALICSALVLLQPGRAEVPGAPAALPALVSVWSTIGLVWLTSRPLLVTMGWAWSTYRRNRVLLDEARDNQVKLAETLEDLEAVNLHQARLSRLSENLRRVAEDERRSKERFVANVSHELRTPLNMIIGFSELIAQAPESYGVALPPALLADLEVINRNSQHLASLVDDILDLGQIEAGQMALIKESASLEDILQSSLVAVRPLYESKALYLHTEIDATLPPVYCDPTRIREVLLNLLSNAARFTSHGGVRICIATEGGAVKVSVHDTGPGIASQDLPRLFQPFQQLDNSLRRRHAGTGLGLSISRNFVELHGGKIWAESQLGQGTTFYFTLPLQLPALPDAVTRWFGSPAPFCERTRPSRAVHPIINPRLLVVERGQALQRLAARYLNSVEIVPLPTLRAAYEEMARTPAQVLLFNNDDMGQSFALLREAGALPAGTTAIVCALPEANLGPGKMGVTDYLVKPVSPAVLLAALSRLSIKGKRVLVVEDELEVQRLVHRILASSGRGYKVLRAGDGQAALNLLRQSPVDVIILDLVMSNMDGFYFLAAKNRDPSLRDIPVIITSAQDPSGHPIVCEAVAVTQGGGLSARQLLTMIQLALGAQPAGESPVDPTQPAAAASKWAYAETQPRPA